MVDGKEIAFGDGAGHADDDANIVLRTAASRADNSVHVAMPRLARCSPVPHDGACWINDLALS